MMTLLLAGHETTASAMAWGMYWIHNLPYIREKLLHQRQDLYPNPRQFQTEGFLGRQFSPYEFMPFGGGVRRCVSDALAMFEMKLVLAMVLLRYQRSLISEQPERPRRRGVMLTPARGVEMMMQ